MIKQIGKQIFTINKANAFDARKYLLEQDRLALLSHVKLEYEDSDDIVYLDSVKTINKHIKHWEVLEQIENLAYEENFAFLDKIKLKTLSSDGLSAVSTPSFFDPLFHVIISNTPTTITDLKTKVTLEDAYGILDSIITKSLTEQARMKAASIKK